MRYVIHRPGMKRSRFLYEHDFFYFDVTWFQDIHKATLFRYKEEANVVMEDLKLYRPKIYKQCILSPVKVSLEDALWRKVK